jgi:hypothetical protein
MRQYEFEGIETGVRSRGNGSCNQCEPERPRSIKSLIRDVEIILFATELSRNQPAQQNRSACSRLCAAREEIDVGFPDELLFVDS